MSNEKHQETISGLSDVNEKVREMVLLLIECRDALPAITLTAAKLHRLDLTLADRIEECLKPWEASADDPDAI